MGKPVRLLKNLRLLNLLLKTVKSHFKRVLVAICIIYARLKLLSSARLWKNEMK